MGRERENDGEREREAPGGKLDHRAPGGQSKGGVGGLDMREGDKQS